MKIKAYAKINLFLDIVGKREDGYHNITSIMQQVDWYDVLNIEENVSGDIFFCNELLPADLKENNIVVKAYRLFTNYTGVPFGVTVSLEKNIPVSAGMAGGSADAAAALVGLNALSPKKVSGEELIKLGASLGADIPFCLTGGTQLITGIGDVRKKVSSLDGVYIVCAKMGDGFSTPEAYRLLDVAHGNFCDYHVHSDACNRMIFDLNHSNTICRQNAFNIFEEIVEPQRPAVSELKAVFAKAGADLSMMSGSGTSVFGLFDNLQNAEKACSEALSKGAEAKVCRPISISLI